MVVRKACVVKSEGLDKEAIQILKNELPAKMAPWARSVKLNGKEKKEALKSLFQSELDRAEDIKQQKAAITAEIEKRFDGHFQNEFTRLKESINQKLAGLKISEFEPRPLASKDADDLLNDKMGAVSRSESSTSTGTKFKLPPLPEVSKRSGGILFDDLEAILDAAIQRCV